MRLNAKYMLGMIQLKTMYSYMCTTDNYSEVGRGIRRLLYMNSPISPCTAWSSPKSFYPTTYSYNISYNILGVQYILQYPTEIGVLRSTST